MKRIQLIAALTLAVSFGPAAAAGDRMLGESLDSGLGELAPTYTAAEYNTAGWVRGESMDSGLGNLPATYTAAEYMYAGWVRGESLDSGLGELAPTYTAAEFMPVIVAARSAEKR